MPDRIVHYVGTITVDPGQRWGAPSPRTRHQVTLWWCTGGAVELPPAVGRLAVGELLFAPIDALLPMNGGSQGASVRWILFEGLALPPIPRRLPLPDPAFLGNLLDRLTRAYFQDGGRHPRVDMWMQAILDELHLDGAAIGPVLDHHLHHQLDALRFRIEAEPHRPWDITRMSVETGMSVAHFRRVFRQVHGLAPMPFVTEIRLRCADNLLRCTDLPVAEIARRVGICDGFQLSRQFRRWKGVSPTAWRAQALSR